MVTEKNFKELENSQASLTLTVDAASIEKAYNDKLSKYAKNIEMPGFRKGHVPTSVIERKFGSDIRVESTFDCLEENLKEAIETLDPKQKPLAYSTPELQDEEKLLPFKKNEAVTFTVKYDVAPQFELPQYTGLTIETVDAKVTDKDIDNEINTLREQNALVVSKDGEAENGDIANIDYKAYNEDGTVDETTKREGFTFTIGTKYNFFKLDDDVIGMKKGDEKTIEKTFTEEDDIPSYEGKTVKIDIKLNELKKRELPEVDDDFAQDVKEEYKTVADLRNGVKADLEKELEETLKRRKQEALMKALIEKTTISVPKSMIDVTLENDWSNFVRQSGLSEDKLLSFFRAQGQDKESFMEGWREPATLDIKKELILSKISEKEDFPVTDEEIEKEGGESLQKMEDEKAKESYKEYIKDNLKYSKTLPYLMENNTFKAEKTLSYEELTKLPEEE